MNPSPTSMVYLVGADPTLAEALQGLLKSVGLPTLACSDVEAFLAVYQPDKPACLLLNAEAPGGDAFEIQQRLREQDITAPVIILAGRADVAMAVTALRQGALDFIEKPFNEQILLDDVYQTLVVDAVRRRQRLQREDLRCRFDTLTAREQDVLRWVVQGLSNQEVAERLNLSRKTVEAHRAKAMQKMQANTLSQLIRIAITIGILKLYNPES